MHKKIDFCINSGQNGYFVLRLKKYLRNTKSSNVESFILALLWFNSHTGVRQTPNTQYQLMGVAN